MKSAVIVFPGSNCDRDAATALGMVAPPPAMVWHGETTLPDVDLIVVPGGFSYGDYLRAGALAAHSPVMRAVSAKARAGVAVLGICNGFQVLTEAGLLPGALMRNAGLRFVCREVKLHVEGRDSIFTAGYVPGAPIHLPIAHNEGNYVADGETLARLEGEGRIVFRYRPGGGNPNGSMADVAGILDASGRVLGMMPHPERAVDPALGGTDGAPLFEGLARALSG